ncbi:MAG TPA: methyltransferase domain-containing protein [Candidatus Acidoferrum sp.]|nr:methyltransferase domain-containing protein [Candidatus Acidoferrum sp.]
MKAPNVSWSRYLRNGAGRRLSQLGERLGQQWLIYNRFVMRQFHDEALFNAPLVVPALMTMFSNTRTVLDVGAGSGAFAAEFQRRGVRAIALERSSHGLALARKQGVDARKFDLIHTPPVAVGEKADLVYSFEVAEHMPPFLGDALIKFLAGFRCPVVFSAAHPNQGGTGHINEQPREYWIQKFAAHGFTEASARSEELRGQLTTAGASRWFQTNPFVTFPS